MLTFDLHAETFDPAMVPSSTEGMYNNTSNYSLITTHAHNYTILPRHTPLFWRRVWLYATARRRKAKTQKGEDASTMTKQVDENWKKLQQTTFTKWVNNALRGHMKTAKTHVNDLQTDLQDGLVLVELIDSIANPRKVGQYNRNPRIKAQNLENLGAVFRFLEREQIKVVNIGKYCTVFHVYYYM